MASVYVHYTATVHVTSNFAEFVLFLDFYIFVFRPHRTNSSVLWSVSVSVTFVGTAKPTEPIEMPLGEGANSSWPN